VTDENPERGVDDVSGNIRGRPGRRTSAEKREAVLSILGGRASVDQMARRYGVHSETVVAWRDAGLLAIEQAMAQGSGPTPRERELQAENEKLKLAVQTLSVERALAVQAIDEWKRQGNPSRPARSRR